MSRTKVLRKTFFEQPTLTVARELLGKYLVRKVGGKAIAAIITEVEAYDGPRDKASHASRGLTPRTKVMFGPPGHWYVYFTYGMHWMLNIVTREKGYPAAVLIRAVEVKSRRRNISVNQLSNQHGSALAINGPARVTKFFRIGKSFNGASASRRTGLWIEDSPARIATRSVAGGGVRIKEFEIKKSPRIGVDYAGPVWSKKKYRFFMTGKCYNSAIAEL